MPATTGSGSRSASRPTGRATLAAMQRTMRASAVCALMSVAVGCGGASKGAPTPTPTPTNPAGTGPAEPAKPPGTGDATPVAARVLEHDEPITSASGATFTASTGWSVADDRGVVTLTGPERDLTLIYLELEADSGEQAIAAAWKRVQPDVALAVAQTDQQPARDGWDGQTQIVYVTPSAEQRVVVAVALGKGRTWRLFLVDGKEAALSRRGAQLGATVTSLKAPGVTRESWAGRPAAALDAPSLAAIDGFVERAMKATGVPGAALAIVQGGKVIHERGFGVRELGKPAKVGPNTLFLTGSTGKSLMTLMMARAVDAGAFGWDTPVTGLLPTFALGDPEVTQALLVRHTVCACTGMPRQDLEMLFEYARVTPEMRVGELAAMTPTTKFGETFQYSNLLVMAGGYAAGHALYPRLKLGPAFDRAMQDQVFAPLGMTRTTYDFARASRGDHATPHAPDLAGTMSPVGLGAETWVTTVRPAGGQWSSVHDYTRVLLLELGKGVLDGKRVISEANLLERRKPQVAIDAERAYGMGLVVGTTNDVPVVTHSGGTAGFTTDYFWLPEHGVGVVIVANVGNGGLFIGAVRRRIFEALFAADAQADTMLTEGVAREQQRVAAELALVKADVDPAWLAPLLGAWTAPGLGRIELSARRGKVVLDAGEWQAPVGEKTGLDGSRSLAITSAPFAGFEVVAEDRAGARALVVRDDQREYVFTRATR